MEQGGGCVPADAVTPETVQDVRRFGLELERLGYGYHEGELQGLVGHDGRWRRIDFAVNRPLPTNPVEAVNARADHQREVERIASEDRRGPQAADTAGDSGSPTHRKNAAGDNDVTGNVDVSGKNDFAREEPAMPEDPPPPQHPLKMNDLDLTELVAEMLPTAGGAL